MTQQLAELRSGTTPAPALRARVLRIAAVVFLGVFPALTVVALFASAIEGDSVATDFLQFHAAAEAILRSESPYEAGEAVAPWGGPFPYPPLPALLAVCSLTLLSPEIAGLVVMALLVVVAMAIPYVLGVRDWRCYGLLLLWPAVISAIQTGNITLWFGLACAIAWRFRDRVYPVAIAIGLTLAAKFFLWPLVVWLAATRRALSAVLACAFGVGLFLGSWGVVGLAGFRDYPDLLRELEDAVGADSYTLYIVGLDLGLPSEVARAGWAAVGLGLIACVVLLARRGDERGAFIVSIAAALALTPIVWLHYFALLAVVVALAQSKLGLVWFVPLGMVVTPGSGQPTPFETSWTLAVAALTIVLALRVHPSGRRDLAPQALGTAA